MLFFCDKAFVHPLLRNSLFSILSMY